MLGADVSDKLAGWEDVECKVGAPGAATCGAAYGIWEDVLNEG